MSILAGLDDEQLYRALLSRDTRFDGVFYVGVTSTRVYCRPVCRAPKPHPKRCRYYATAAAAERRGFRPCLRCRPELAPGEPPASPVPSGGDTASIDAVGRLARTVALRISAGALDRGGLTQLAADLGVSTRHLRRAVERELGATPVQLAQTRRLLTAKHLLSETRLPITQVALASGFRSLRRFNALFRARYRLVPSALRPGIHSTRGTPAPATSTEMIYLALAYRPPFDWATMAAYLAVRATPGVEAVTAGGGGQYWRSVQLHGHRGYIVIGPAAGAPLGRVPPLREHSLRLGFSAALLPVLIPLLARVRRLLDLDADPIVIATHLAGDPTLAPFVALRPGLRVPGAIDGFDLALRAVLGQQVTVRGGTTLAGRLAQLVSEPLVIAPQNGPLAVLITRLPITAQRLAEAGLGSIAGIGLPRARAQSIRALARAVAGGELPELVSDVPGTDPTSVVRRLRAVPGIGAWTASYIVMRALRWPDALPEDDLGLRRAMGGLSPARLRAAAESWRPWRAYAAQHLWASLTDRARDPHQLQESRS